MLKMKLSCHDRSHQVQSNIKTKQDNYVIDRTGLVYVETKIELSEPIK